jgi:predicted glutamine amidotransferase
MCRLFGMHAGTSAVPATFWLIDAPDSLRAQSHRNPDGTGIGAFGRSGEPMVVKQPLAAWQDPQFALAAQDLTGTTFLAHVRYASTGDNTVANTHPFLQNGRLFAHNGVVGGLDKLDARLAELRAGGLVLGETDSERVFALISAEIARHDDEVSVGLVAAIGWIIDQLPVYAMNLILSTATDMWALRYPSSNELHVLVRPAGGTGTNLPLDARTDRIHARSPQLADRPAVVLASEPMDGDPGWRALEPGELLHVAPDLTVDIQAPFPSRPRHLLQLSHLAPMAAASQRPSEAVS